MSTVIIANSGTVYNYGAGKQIIGNVRHKHGRYEFKPNTGSHVISATNQESLIKQIEAALAQIKK
jgi:hypothetical protein